MLLSDKLKELREDAKQPQRRVAAALDIDTATYLDKKTAQIDSSIASLETQRDDLNALKQSIISEAVTGKIDLRDWKLKK